MAFVKLYDQLLQSSIIEEGITTRWVWICLLLSCDKNGNVYGTHAALARQANVSINEFCDALEVLMSPDQESTSESEGGRRVVDAGPNLLHCVNYLHYRQMEDPDTQREKWRQRKAKQRDKRKAKSDGHGSHENVPPCPPIGDGDGNKEGNGKQNHHIVTLAEILDYWNLKTALSNVNAETIIKPTSANGKRRRSSALARIAEHPSADDWRLVIDRIAARPFNLGENDNGWRADVEYLFRVTTFDAYTDGKFSQPPKPRPTSNQRSPATGIYGKAVADAAARRKSEREATG